MPFRKTAKKPARKIRRKVTQRRRTYAARPRRQLTFARSPMPIKFATKLRYQETLSLDPGASGATALYKFAANDVYDPNITATGHQPRGYDQLQPMYEYHTVIGARISIRFYSNSTSDTPLRCGIALRATSTADTYANYAEQSGVRTVVLPCLTGQVASRTLSMTFSARRFFSSPKPMSDSELRGANGPPSRMAYFHIFAAPGTSVDPAAILFDVLIDYLVVFHEPTALTQS